MSNERKMEMRSIEETGYAGLESTDTMEERFDETFDLDSLDKGLQFNVKHFIRQEIFLALQKRNEELVGKVEAIEVAGDKEENKGIADIYRQIWDTSFKPIVLNIIQQP